MNHIKRLECAVGELQAELTGLKSGLVELEKYLQSPKFYLDPTVQVRDVLTRLAECYRAGYDLRADAEQANAARIKEEQDRKAREVTA